MSKIIGFEIFDDRVELEILRPRKGEHKQTYGLCGRMYTVPMNEIEHILPRSMGEGEKLIDYLKSFCNVDFCIETHTYKDDDNNVVNTITGVYDLLNKYTDATAGRT